MLDCAEFYRLLARQDIRYFVGIPDSLLRSFCAYIADHASRDQHIVAANEGGAVGLAAGYYLATGRVGLVYMQNSGEGNAINPLASLADSGVYAIPMLLLIGWRGEPGTTDEPQHMKQGRVTRDLLHTLEIPNRVLPQSGADASEAVIDAVRVMKKWSSPYGLIVRKNTFEDYGTQADSSDSLELGREEAIRIILSRLDRRAAVVATTGHTSREVFECRRSLGQTHAADFLAVGSMGHASQIALAVALARPHEELWCLDGDGSLIMHMGSIAVVGSRSPRNLRHVVLNNGVHDSVGALPTAGFAIDIPAIAKACGYRSVFRTTSAADLREKLTSVEHSEGPVLIEVRVRPGRRRTLGRPTISPASSKEAFMSFVRGTR